MVFTTNKYKTDLHAKNLYIFPITKTYFYFIYLFYKNINKYK